MSQDQTNAPSGIEKLRADIGDSAAKISTLQATIDKYVADLANLFRQSKGSGKPSLHELLTLFSSLQQMDTAILSLSSAGDNLIFSRTLQALEGLSVLLDLLIKKGVITLEDISLARKEHEDRLMKKVVEPVATEPSNIIQLP